MRGDEAGRPQVAALDRIGSEMLVEPRAPDRVDGVAGLKHGLEPPRAPAVDEAEMAAVFARHQFQDHPGLAVLAASQHDAVVGPLHAVAPNRYGGGKSLADPVCRESFKSRIRNIWVPRPAKATLGRAGPAARKAA